MVDCPFNEDSKIAVFSRNALISGEGRPGNLSKIGNRDIYCYTNRGLVNFETEYWSVPNGMKIFVVSQFSYRPYQIIFFKK